MDPANPACGRRIERGLIEEISAMKDRLRNARLDLEKPFVLDESQLDALRVLARSAVELP